LTSINLVGQHGPVLRDSADLRWTAAALVIGTITFNAALCFINTQIAPIHNSYVVGSEMLLMTIALLACYRLMEPRDVLIIGAIILYSLILAYTRSGISSEEGFNVKAARDFLIPVTFVMLGKSQSIKLADTVVYAATVIILGFALFEFLFFDTYLQMFGVTEYYIARGTLDASDPSLQYAGGLMVSGIRPVEQGRALLSFLGYHRVSSLFLEPIGLGNFGCLVALWGIARSKMERRPHLWLIAAGVALIVLSDTRFNAAFLGVGALILLAPPRITTPAVFAMPFILIVGLLLTAVDVGTHDYVPMVEGLSLQDRLLYSGRVLLDFDLLNWLGMQASRAQTFDAGYAYVISNVGLIGLAAFWFWFMSLRGHSRYFYAFRNANAAYFALLFCISTSQFTIKTAGLLWFLMGALSAERRQDVVERMHQPRGALSAASSG
jgi:putative polymerase